jgi:UDP-N-acetylmuramate--alanine ligase
VILDRGARVHIVGIGGAGMSGLARLLSEMGCAVSGSDAAYSPTVEELLESGIQVHVGHDATNVGAVDVVLWSPAVQPDNVELLEASRRGAVLLSRSEVLKELAERQPVVGLTGTHGKTTATSMMSMIMHAAGRDYSRLLGASVTGLGANGHFGSDGLILEVDESYGTFALLSPYALGVLNVEADHLDFYGTLDVLEDAFTKLIERTTGPVVVWMDDEGARRVVQRSSREVLGVGSSTQYPWRVSGVGLARRSASFTLEADGHCLAIELGVTGAHNVANAAVTATLALALGVDEDSVVMGLQLFKGAPRRFQYLGLWRGVDVYEDYAHLPGEIAATLRATAAAGYGRIGVVFQPHRVTRTLNLAESFATAFVGAAFVVVADIYSAGEANPSGATGEFVANLIRQHEPTNATWYEPTFDDVIAKVEALHDECDVLLLLGAGDIAGIASQLDGMTP